MKKTQTVEIVQETVSAIRAGKDVYIVKPTNDGRGLHLENGKGSIFVPFGDVGKAIVQVMQTQVNKPFTMSKGKRRSRVAISAQGAIK